MKIFCSLSFILFISITYAQDSKIKGSIIDSKTKKIIEFVNIGISKKGVGTVSGRDGLFTLKLRNTIQKNDSVVFSHIGYKTQKIQVSELENTENTIALEPVNNILDEVTIIKSKTPKPKKIGRSSKGLGLMHMNFYTYDEADVDDRLSKEVGMQFNMKSNCQIDSLTFNITSNDFKKLKFRVNFYKIENGVPTAIIVHQNIIFDIENEFLGWFTVNLKPYDIYFDNSTGDIAITIQWLESIKVQDRSKYFSISTAKSPLNVAFYRKNAMDNWIKSSQSLSFYLHGMCN